MIGWQEYTDEWGNKFPDGESYSLIYPEVTIPEDAYYVPLIGAKGEVPYAKVRCASNRPSASTVRACWMPFRQRPESRARSPGAERRAAQSRDLQERRVGQDLWDDHPSAALYLCPESRPLQDAADANAIWNITNVTRSGPPLPLHDRCLCRSSSRRTPMCSGISTRFPGVEQDGRRCAGYLQPSDEQGTACRDER